MLEQNSHTISIAHKGNSSGFPWSQALCPGPFPSKVIVAMALEGYSEGSRHLMKGPLRSTLSHTVIPLS